MAEVYEARSPARTEVRLTIYRERHGKAWAALRVCRTWRLFGSCLAGLPGRFAERPKHAPSSSPRIRTRTPAARKRPGKLHSARVIAQTSAATDNCTMRLFSIPILLMLGAIVALSMGTSTSQGSNAELAKRIGPIVTVASGSGWSLRAWQSSSGLCVSYRPLAGGDFCHVRLPRGSSLFTFVRDLGGRTLVIGAIARNVARVKVKDRKGRSLWARIFEPPRSLNTRLRFFRVVVQSGSPPKWRAIAYDPELRQVGLVGQGN